MIIYLFWYGYSRYVVKKFNIYEIFSIGYFKDLVPDKYTKIYNSVHSTRFWNNIQQERLIEAGTAYQSWAPGWIFGGSVLLTF
jgi:hypothetical protein